MSKIIVVFGAAGSQGGAVARALLSTPAFKVRAVTRNPTSPKALALRAAAADLVQDDLNDPPTVDAALQGAYGAYVTSYWASSGDATHPSYDAEVAQGKRVADAAIRAGLTHYAYSSLDPIKEQIGKPCPDFDSKAEIEKYVVASGVPYTIVHFPFYFDNFAGLMPPQKQSDGTFTLTAPMQGAMYGMGLDCAGPVLAAIFGNPDEYLGEVVKMAADKLTFHGYADIISQVTGKTVKYDQVSAEEFGKLPFPGANEIAVMFEYYSTGIPKHDIEATRKMNPGTLTFKQWADRNKNALLAVLA